MSGDGHGGGDRNRQDGGMNSTRSDVLAPAIRRFPEQRESVIGLAERSEAFRDMCEELAAAEAALASLGTSDRAGVEARRLECAEWIERLAGEMTRALSTVSVLFLADHRRH